MDPKLLTEDGWKANVVKFKLKDKELQRALFFYENLEDDDFDFRLKALGKIAALASGLKRDREIAANDVVVKYLADMASAVQTAQRDVAKAKAEAEKAKALTQKKADAQAKQEQLAQQKAEQEGDEEEEEEEEGDSFVKLTSALKTLKLSQKPYYFLVCDAKPYGLVISKKDIRKSAQAKKELARIAGGSARPPKFGECRCEGGKYLFEMEKPPSGLARILQKWIKESTGLGLKVMVGTESSDDEEEPEGKSDPRAAAAIDSALKASREIAEREKKTLQMCSGWIKKITDMLAKVSDEEAVSEGMKIKTELKRLALNHHNGPVLKVKTAAEKLAAQKTAEAAELVKEAVEAALPGFKVLDDLTDDAMSWTALNSHPVAAEGERRVGGASPE